MNKNIIRKIFICLLLVFSITLVSCGDDEQSQSAPNPDNNIPVETPVQTPVETPKDTYTPQVCAICEGDGLHAKSVTYPTLSAHTPTTFKESSVNKTTKNLVTGVDQHTYTITLNNGNKSKIVVTEIDLKYAGIAAGTKDNKLIANSLSTPYSMATAYEKKNPDKTVIVATNGDFYGAVPVNAFVKDGTIIKDSHNDNGGYDYTNVNYDIPASKPMLFGVSGTTAQIKPIIQNGTIKETIQSKLGYELTLTRDGESSTLATDYVYNAYTGSKTKINIVHKTLKEALAVASSTVLTVKKHETVGDYVHGEVTKIEHVATATKYQATSDTYYIFIPDVVGKVDIKLGDIISNQITSADGTWAYYNTIIGCRQSLVADGEIPATVTKENTNGAQRTDIPRTAIGVLSNGHVVLFSVEALRYGGKGTSSDPYGLNLPQLADFMRYIGVYDGANFDGGGSTQLLTRLTPTSDFTVMVRSSDTAGTQPKDTRAVINSVLVYIKNEE